MRSSSPTASPHRLYRDPERGRVAGVCAGLADYLGIEPFVLRVGTVLGLIFLSFFTILGYVILAFMLPRRPPRTYASQEEETFIRSARGRPGVTLETVRNRFSDLDQRLGRIEAHVTTREFQLDRAIRDLEKGR